MRGLTAWLVTRLIPDHERTDDLVVRSRYGRLEGWVSVVLTFAMFLVKIAAGLAVRSVALIADAMHTLSDCATSAVVILGFSIAKKPSDREHPYGHARMEPIATLVVAVLLFVVAAEFLKESVCAIVQPRALRPPPWMIGVLLGTVLIKVFLARFANTLAVTIDSKALKADAIHHLSDVWATGLVVLALVAAQFGFMWVDGAMGLVVCAIIAFSAYAILRETVDTLLGHAPATATIVRIRDLARAFEGVTGVHDITVHEYGRKRLISLHIEVSDKIAVSALHELSEQVEARISEEFEGTTVVHIDPVNKDHPLYAQVRDRIGQLVAADARVASFHDLRIVGTEPDPSKLVFDVVLAGATRRRETEDVIDALRRRLNETFPAMQSRITVEPRYRYTPEPDTRG